ncbi:MAG: hypothetical protein IT372_13215 [Polyangiaceae bacterium]|nr:hypothetical protein [Polyangiaceae bacterium]
MRPWLRPLAAISLACALLPACASDAGPEPEPTLETPGAFTAVDEGAGHLSLYRTLDTLRVQGDVLIYLTHYDVHPETWEAARELSKRPDLPIFLEVTNASRRLFPSGPFQVVWYRSLSEEEEALVH